jgi:hypothetical protein
MWYHQCRGVVSFICGDFNIELWFQTSGGDLAAIGVGGIVATTSSYIVSCLLWFGVRFLVLIIG